MFVLSFEDTQLTKVQLLPSKDLAVIWDRSQDM